MSHELIIYLDLDSTLVHSIFAEDEGTTIELDKVTHFIKNSKLHKVKDRIHNCTLVDSQDHGVKGVGELESYYLILRPHTEEFIEYISNNCAEIHIWSAGQFRYVKSISHVLFPPDASNLNLHPAKIFTRQDTEFGEEYVLKDLNLKHTDLSKVLIIDDRDDTFRNNHHNGIHIPIYAPEINETELGRDDKTLLELIAWFESLKYKTYNDIRDVDKDNIFEDFKQYLTDDEEEYSY